jgi:hypothetical protein
MGWGGGTRIAADIIYSIEEHVGRHQDRIAVYKDVIRALENEDWDNLDESEGLSSAFDTALAELYPEEFAR